MSTQADYYCPDETVNEGDPTPEEMMAQRADERAAELMAALNVIILTPHIREYLERTDPMALKQCTDALLGLGGPVETISGFGANHDDEWPDPFAES